MSRSDRKGRAVHVRVLENSNTKMKISAPFSTRFLIILLVLAAISVTSAQQLAVPVDVQLPLLFKVLSYDRTLSAKTTAQLHVGILFQRSVRASVETKDAVLALQAAGALNDLDGIPLEFVPIDITDEPGWPATLAFIEPNILYVTPLHGVAVQSIATICRGHQIASITGVPEYVERGLSIGISGTEGKPQIIVNLSASIEEGLHIGSQALKLARLVGKERQDVR